MIVIRLKGGLGNQLFQYSAGYSLSKRLNQDLYVDTSYYVGDKLRSYKLDCLNIDSLNIAHLKEIPYRIKLTKNRYINKAVRVMNKSCFSIGKDWKFLIETGTGLIDEFFSVHSKNVFVDGYYQSSKYFDSFRSDLLDKYSPNYKMDEQYYDVLSNIERVNSVAVHVRRGDFARAQYANPRHYLLNEHYYCNAMKIIKDSIYNPVFFWFSDDINWVKEKFGKNTNDKYIYVSLSTIHPDIDEMMLMSKCKNIITANSTFSWWAAWLNKHDDAMILCPEKAYGIPEMIPDRWEKIRCE